MQMSFWRFDQMREVKIEDSVKREKDIITKERKKQKKLGREHRRRKTDPAKNLLLLFTDHLLQIMQRSQLGHCT